MAENTPLFDFSQALADAAEAAGAAAVLVNARSRMPASGILYQGDLVLTADHVVERDEEISIFLPDGQELPASVAGRDPGSDLALLRLAAPAGAPAVPAGRAARVGELVLALGRPSNAGIQASLGVVSAVRGVIRPGRRSRRRMGWMRSAESFILTDAVPLPGFSGGPLIDASGKVLGLNTSGLVPGRSVAIPVERAFATAAALAEHGSVRRGYLGIRSQATALSKEMQAGLGREQESGLLIVWTEDGSPAAAGGLIVGDILVGISGQEVADHEDLQSALMENAVGQAAEVEILRGGQRAVQMVTIGERQS